MRPRQSFAVAALVAATAAPAQSQTLSLDGVWGNAAGCKAAAGDSFEDDTLRVLRPDGIMSYASECEWLQVLAAKDGTQVATGLCHFEGDEGLGARSFVIARNAADDSLIRVYHGDGELWGEVTKCP